MMPDLGPMRRAFSVAINAIPKTDRYTRDVGAVALARHYADLIDQAAAPDGPLADALELLRLAAQLAADTEEKGGDRYTKAHRRIAAALSATTVASDLGPKLMATLTALGMTPASRGAGGGGKSDDIVGTTLADLRKKRAERAEHARQHHPANLDTTAS